MPANKDMQLTLMNARAIALIAGERDRWQLAGDQFYVDLDLSDDNLPPGTRLALGSAVLAVWLYGFLRPEEEATSQITLSGVHLYPGDGQGLPGAVPNPALERTSELSLPEQTLPEAPGNGEENPR